MKLKKQSEQTELDQVIFGCSLYPLNLNSNIGWGIVIYIHSKLPNSNQSWHQT